MTGRRFVVTGTDTDVGKTIFAAGLVRAVDGSYWKPIQSGLADEIDSQVVARLSALPPDRILPEAYRLTNPLSPHRASELDGIEIDTARLVPPDIARPLVIEGAGGLMVPITRRVLQSDLFVKWQIPVILVARTGLGTINHSLMSIAALRMYEIPLHGIAFVGDANEDNERTICEIGKAKHLGRLPRLAPLTAESLVTAFSAAFRLEDFV